MKSQLSAETYQFEWRNEMNHRNFILDVLSGGRVR